MDKHDVDRDAVAFIEKFLDKEYSCWEVTYRELDNKKFNKIVAGFVEEFYSFEAITGILRSKEVSVSWLDEAKRFLGATIRRPLFKIEQYTLGGEVIFAACTGSNDLGSDSYFEVIIFRRMTSQYKIFSIYLTDPEGGFEFHDGSEFSFSQAQLVAIKKFLAPQDEADLMDYNMEPL